jgi:hypothetical protein
VHHDERQRTGVHNSPGLDSQRNRPYLRPMTSTTSHLCERGTITLPASVLERLNTGTVTVIDCGDHLVVRPTPEDPIAALAGKYAGAGPTSDELREFARIEDELREAAR